MKWIQVMMALSVVWCNAAVVIPLELDEWQVESPGLVANDTETVWPGGAGASIAFRHPDYATSRISRRVAVEPRTNYMIRARVKLDCPYLEMRGYAGLTLTVRGADGAVLGQTPPLTMISDWREAGFAFASGGYTELEVSWSISDARGEAWIGEMILEKIDDPALLGDVTPPDFEVVPPLEMETAPFRLFRSHPQERPWATRGPHAGEALATLELRAAANEIEGAAFGVYADAPVRSLQVELTGELKSASGAVLPRELVTLQVATPERFALDTLRYWMMGVFLYPNQPVDLEAGRSIRFFMTVEVPAGTSAGEYMGGVRVAAQEGEIRELPVKVTVRPFALPEPEVPFFMYHNLGVDREILRDMKRHGMNSLTIYDSASIAQGTLSTTVPYVVEQMRAAGWETGRVPLLYLYTNQADWLAYFCPPLEVLRQLRAEGEKQDWPELLTYCVDEPNTPEAVELARRALQLVREEVPEARKVTAIGKGGIVRGLADWYEVMILDSMDMDEELRQMVSERPDKQWLFYECRQNGKTPLVDRYGCGFYQDAMGGGGFAQWVYTDPARASDSGTGIVYGHVKVVDGQIIPTLGWEGKREGIDDYRYILLLESVLAAHAGCDDPAVRRLCAEGAGFLASIRRQIRPDSYRERLARQDGVSFRLDNVPQPELTAEYFDQWRETTAMYITRIQQMGHHHE